MYRKILLLLAYLIINLYFGLYFANAQDTENTLSEDIFFHLKTSKIGEGKIILSQSTVLNNLIAKHRQINKNLGRAKIKGYRIQIYRGVGSDARNKANNVSMKFMTNFPNFSQNQIYAIYETPYFKLRVGDYRNKNEAFEHLFKIKKIFPEAYIVNSNINYPEL